MRKILLVSILLECMFLISACGDSKESIDIDNVDVNQEFLSMSLTENVKIEAEITPYSQYKNGLNVYIAEDVYDGSAEKVETLFGKNISSQLEFLHQYDVADFDLSGLEVISSPDSYQIRLNDQDEIQMRIFWSITDNKLRATELYYPAITGNNSNDWSREAMDAFIHTEHSRVSSSDNSSDMDGIGEYVYTFLSEFTGREVYPQYVLVPLENFGENSFALFFYYQVDGFPWKLMSKTGNFGANANLSESVRIRESSPGVVSTLMEWPQIIFYSNSKISGLELTSFAVPGEIYQESRKVSDIRSILKQCKNYFDSTVLLSEITVTSIKIGYDTYFTDASEGEKVQNTIQPFWYVEYYSEEEGNVWIVFDAFSGEIMRTGNPLS